MMPPDHSASLTAPPASQRNRNEKKHPYFRQITVQALLRSHTHLHHVRAVPAARGRRAPCAFPFVIGPVTQLAIALATTRSPRCAIVGRLLRHERIRRRRSGRAIAIGR